MINRRTFLGTAVAGTINGFLPISSYSSAKGFITLKAAPTRVRLVPEPHNMTNAWGYNQAVPGPEIRVRQGERIRVLVENDLDEETTVHWHGVRLPNEMDGVPHLTQTPVAPGKNFLYEFDAVDAGTFWYHPHQRSFEQVGRGLYGPLIIEEQEPIRVDRDITWMLDDWRLLESAEIRDDFGNGHDMSHNGRVGNTVTINGELTEEFQVHRGERIRLRLVNAANARIFALDFADHNPRVIAMDGQPVTPHSPENGRIVLGPAMRIDLVLDMTGDPGNRHIVTDSYYQGLEYPLIDLVYSNTVVREEAPDWSMALPDNGLTEPNMEQAIHHEIVFTGGMMGGMVMDRMEMDAGSGMMEGMGSMMDMMRSGKIWQINGVAAEGHVMDPMLTLERGSSYILNMINATAWDHPIHLHGHSFRVLSRNGVKTTHQEWQDTVLMSPEERVEIALVADNPGDWMFHCHILEHQAAGMMGVIRVS